MSKKRHKEVSSGTAKKQAETPRAARSSRPAATAASAPKPRTGDAAAFFLAPGKTGLPLHVLAGILLFFLIAFQGGTSDKVLAVVAAGVLIICSVGKAPWEIIRRRLSVPVLAVMFYVLLNAAAGLYSKFGVFSAGEFAKIFTAFCVFFILLFRLKEENGRSAALVFSTVTAAFSLISIDASSLGALTRVYVGLMNRLGCEYNAALIGYESGVRITGLFRNANVLAGFLAFGVLLSLYLVQSAPGGKGRLLACLLLEVNALGFLLAFSMGAIGMFMVSILIYLLVAAKGSRLSLLVLMVETAVLAVGMAFPAFLGLGAQGAAAWLPVLAGPIGGVVLWLLHSRAGLRLGEGLGRHPKAAVGTFCAVIVFIAAYAAWPSILQPDIRWHPAKRCAAPFTLILVRIRFPAVGRRRERHGGKPE
jgi:hypothetical protein